MFTVVKVHDVNLKDALYFFHNKDARTYVEEHPSSASNLGKVIILESLEEVEDQKTMVIRDNALNKLSPKEIEVLEKYFKGIKK